MPPIPKKVLASLSIKEHDDNKFSSIDIAGPVSNELHGSGELSSLVSPSTETSVIHSHGDANANISTSTYLLHDEDMDESPSPFNFHKVLSMKPGHDPRSTRISYSTQDDIGYVTEDDIGHVKMRTSVFNLNCLVFYTFIHHIILNMQV